MLARFWKLVFPTADRISSIQLRKAPTVETPFHDGSPSLFSISTTGIVDVKITRRRPGRVWYEATYWPARLQVSDDLSDELLDGTTELLPEQEVQVVGREGIMLIVIPILE